MPRTIIILGAGGRLGAALGRAYADEFHVISFNRAQLDLNDTHALRSEIGAQDFQLLVNCAALTNVDYCESHSDEAFAINAEAPGVLSEVCRARQAKMVHISTDYVFDGEQNVPYREEDEATPLSVYGQSKLDGERNVLKVSPDHLVVRVSWIFGPDRASFVDQVIARARETSEIAAVADKISTPTFTLDLATWLRTAWENGARGRLHLANGGECSWQQYAQYALDCCREAGVPLKGTRVAPLPLAKMSNFVARRPVYTVLSTKKFERLGGVAPRSWREAVADYIRNHIART